MRDGYQIVPDVLCARDTQELTNAFARMSTGRSRAGMRHLLSVPAVAALARDRRLIELVASVLGRNPVPFGATLFDKSVTANWLVTWHQDTALPLIERYDVQGWGPWSVKQGIFYAHAPAMALVEVLAVRVHLDDSSHENGPLRVLPRTHTRGVLSDEEVRALAQTVAPVTCTATRGSVLAMRPLLIHASSKVNSTSPRRVLHLEYAATTDFGNGLRLRIAPGWPGAVTSGACGP